MAGRKGMAGTDSKGDVEVEFEEAEGGGVDIIIVPAAPEEGSTDGEALDAVARELLADFEMDNCKVTMRDHGAVGWVAKARVDCAMQRAGVGK